MINILSKTLPLLLLSYPTPTHSRTIEIVWVIPKPNTTYATEIVAVGDKALFYWPVDPPHNVYIHPTGDCSQDGRIMVGNNYDGTEYKFEAEDAGKEITFACDVGFGKHCELGQIMKFQVENDVNTQTGPGSGSGTGGGKGDGSGGAGGNGQGGGDEELNPDILDSGAAGFVPDRCFGLMLGGIVSLLYVAVW